MNCGGDKKAIKSYFGRVDQGLYFPYLSYFSVCQFPYSWFFLHADKMKMKLRSKHIKACLQNPTKNEGSTSKTEETSSKRKLTDKDASSKEHSPPKVSKKSTAVKAPRAGLSSLPIILDAETSDALLTRVYSMFLVSFI